MSRFVQETPVLSGSITTKGRISLSWTPVTMPAATVTAYRVYRSVNADLRSPVLLGTTVPGTRTYVDLPTFHVSTYYYVVPITVEYGELLRSNVQAFIIEDAGGTVVLSGSVNAGTGNGELSWTAADEYGWTLLEYKLYRSLSADLSAPVLVYTGLNRTYADPLEATVPTWYYVVPVSVEYGNRPVSNAVSLLLTPVGVVLSGEISEAGAGALSWTPATEIGYTLDGYEVYRSLNADYSGPVKIYDGALLAFGDTMTPEVPAWYWVKIRTVEGYTIPLSNIVTLTLPYTAPVLSGEVVGEDASLSWVPAVQLGWTLDHYVVYRSLAADLSDPVMVGTTGGTTKTDTLIAAIPTWYYVVPVSVEFGALPRSNDVDLVLDDGWTPLIGQPAKAMMVLINNDHNSAHASFTKVGLDVNGRHPIPSNNLLVAGSMWAAEHVFPVRQGNMLYSPGISVQADWKLTPLTNALTLKAWQAAGFSQLRMCAMKGPFMMTGENTQGNGVVDFTDPTAPFLNATWARQLVDGYWGPYPNNEDEVIGETAFVWDDDILLMNCLMPRYYTTGYQYDFNGIWTFTIDPDGTPHMGGQVYRYGWSGSGAKPNWYNWQPLSMLLYGDYLYRVEPNGTVQSGTAFQSGINIHHRTTAELDCPAWGRVGNITPASSSISWYTRLRRKGNLLFIYGLDYARFEVWDITDPANPTSLGGSDFIGRVDSMIVSLAVRGNLVYTLVNRITNYNDSGVDQCRIMVYDITGLNGSSIVLAARLDNNAMTDADYFPGEGTGSGKNGNSGYAHYLHLWGDECIDPRIHS